MQFQSQRGVLLVLSVMVLTPAWYQRAGAVRPEIVLQLGHRDEVIAVAFSPDGRVLASAAKYFMDHSGEVKLWDVASGALKRTLRGPLEHVSSLAFARDGITLATGSSDRTIRLWDVRTGKLQRTLPLQGGAVVAVAFSPDGATLASVVIIKKNQELSSEIKLWNSRTLRPRRSWQTDDLIDRVLFMPNGKLILTQSVERPALWDIATGKVKQSFLVRDPEVRKEEHKSYLIPATTIRQEWCRAIAVSPTGTSLAIGTDDAVVLWDARSGMEQRRLKFSESMKCIAFSPDGKTLVAGFASHDGETLLRWWDVATGRLLRLRKGTGEWINDMAWSPDGQTLACGEARHMVSLWDARSGQLKRPPCGRVDAVGPAAFSPSGASLVTGNEDGTLRWWNLGSGRLWRTINEHTGTINGLAFSRDGHQLLSAGEDGLLQVWDTGNGLRHLHKWQIPAPETMAVSPDNALIATTNGNSASERTVLVTPPEKSVRVWDARTGKLLQLIAGHSEQVVAATFAPDNKTLATASYDATVKLWDVRAGVCRATLKHPKPVLSIAYSRDGHLLASGSEDGIIRLWDGHNSILKRSLKGHSGGVLTLCFTPDGMLLSAGRDQAVRSWNPHTGALLHTQHITSKQVWAQVFSRDGKRLAAMDADGATTLWDCASGKLLVSLLILPPVTDQDVSTQWIAYTPDGYYDAPPAAEALIRWRVGDQLFPVEWYREEFHRPDLVRKVLSAR